MVSMDTLLHEWSPRRSRGLVFSTRDTVLGASFVSVNLLAGVVIIGSFGVTYLAATSVLGVADPDVARRLRRFRGRT